VFAGSASLALLDAEAGTVQPKRQAVDDRFGVVDPTSVEVLYTQG
jgi:hypothetical protein